MKQPKKATRAEKKELYGTELNWHEAKRKKHGRELNEDLNNPTESHTEDDIPDIAA